MTITSSRKANITCKQGGGSKKQGGPLVANISNLTNRAEKENGVFGARNRNIVFCMNQIGGVGRGKNHFKSNKECQTNVKKSQKTPNVATLYPVPIFFVACPR